MHELPNEILHVIFTWAHCDAYHDYRSRPWPPIELTISAVCTRWREVCTSCPILWSVYRCVAPTVAMLQRERDRLEVYLSRSHPVQLQLSFRFASLYSSSDALLEILHLTVKHADRWLSFSLVSDGRDNAVVLFHPSLSTLSATQLEHLEIRSLKLPVVVESEGWCPLILCQDSPPPIRFLRLDASAVSTNSLLRLENLARFILDSTRKFAIDVFHVFPFSSFVEILKLPCLETISLSANLWYPAERYGYVEAKSLKHFRIRCPNSISVLLFFIYNVSAPVLESLTIHRSTLAWGLNDLTLSSSVNEPFPSLKSLHLIGNDIRHSAGDHACLEQLAKRTLQATQLTISPFPDSSPLQILAFCPGEVIWNTIYPPPEDIQKHWPRLTRLITSACHLRPWAEIVVEEFKQVERIVWPPGYKWASCDEDDPFFYDRLEAFSKSSP